MLEIHRLGNSYKTQDCRARGSILVAALWILVFFVILSVGVSSGISTEIRVFKKLEELVLSAPLARSACLDIGEERATVQKNFDSVADLARVRVFKSGMGRVEYSMVDESARIDLNTASAEILARVPGLNPVLAGNIVRTSRPFVVPELILLVEGIDQHVWEQCRPYLTVYSDGRVNVNTASSEVLAALGFDDGLIQDVLDFRVGQDGVEGTDDDKFFEDAAAIAAEISARRVLSVTQKATLEKLVGQLSVRASAVTVTIRTFILNRPAVDYSVVMDQGKIRRWSEQ